MRARTNPTRRGEPVHVVLDSEALSELITERPVRTLLVALEAAASTSGQAVLPTSVIVEQRFDHAATWAANANRRLRTAARDDLTVDRASTAVRLLLGAAKGSSVVDAHVAAAALDRLRDRAGAAVVVTSDPSDLAALLAAERDADVRSRATVRVL